MTTYILNARNSATSEQMDMSPGSAMKELPFEPRGIFWEDDFITPEHEQKLVQIFRSELAWPDRTGRISLHYGYTFDYKTFGVDPDIPYKAFPDWLVPLIPSYEGRIPEQVCLQYYPPGAGIPPHVDTHSTYDQLYSLSLGSPVIMQFRRGDDRVDVDLTPRSLVKMAGDSRLHWTHSIKKRKTDTIADGIVRPRQDRWSITYRWLRPGAECNCGNLTLCDTAQRRQGVEKAYRWKQYEADAGAGTASSMAEKAAIGSNT